MLQVDPITLRELSIGFWCTVVGYYALLSVYFLLIRFRKKKHFFHLSISTFFLFLAIGRIFLIIHDFFTPVPVTYSLYWRLGLFFQWLSLGTFSVTTGVIILRNKMGGWALAAPATVFGIINLIAPSELMEALNYPVNYIIAILYAVVIPLLMFYVAFRSPGYISLGFWLMGWGFLVLYLARAMHAQLAKEILSPYLGLIFIELGAPVIAVIGLILVVAGAHQAFE